MAMTGSDYMTTLSSVRTSPKWSFKGKPTSAKKPQTPGPGEYEGNLNLETATLKAGSNPNGGFGGTSPRSVLKPPAAPGPGAYSPSDPTQVSTRYGFGTSQRSGMKSRSTANPGPGSYEQKHAMGLEGPKFTAAPRRQVSQQSEVPGPGSYEAVDSAVSEAGPRFRFGTSPRNIRKSNSSPGPGAYCVNDGANAKGGPSPTMGCRREGTRINESPGPGEYCGAHTSFGY